jgi:hypothetical protein
MIIPFDVLETADVECVANISEKFAAPIFMVKQSRVRMQPDYIRVLTQT